MTEGDFGRVLGAVLLRAFDEIRAATASLASGDKALGANDVTGSVRESPRPRFLESEIAELLADGHWRTLPEIAEKAKGGIGARRGDVEACLLGRRDLFVAANGREHGRSPRATVYQLVGAEATGASLLPEIPDMTRASQNGEERSEASRGESDEPALNDRSAHDVVLRLRLPADTAIGITIGGES